MAGDSPAILLTGYYGWGNFGDDILLMVTYNLVKNLVPNASISIEVAGPGTDYIARFFPEATVLEAGRLGHFDAIIHGGGGVLFDYQRYPVWHRLWENVIETANYAPYLCATKTLRRLLNKPLTSADKRLAIGVGVGTFTPGSARLRGKLKMLEEIDAIWVRDPHSLDNLARFNRLMDGKKILGSDLAFLAESWGGNIEKPDRGKTRGKPKLGVILRDWAVAPDNTLSGDILRSITALSADYAITGLVFEEAADQQTIRALADYPLVIWQPEQMEISEFAQALQAQDVLLTARAHGAICGACLGVPSAVIAIEPKLRRVQEMLPASSTLLEPDRPEEWPEKIEQARSNSAEYLVEDVRMNQQKSLDAFNHISPILRP